MQDRAVGQLVAGLVVVGDDHLHPQRPRERDLLDRGDPAVDRDEQRGAALGQPLDVGGAEPVAVGEPVGDQPVALGAQLAQRADQDRRRADAVDVEVAVDGDPLAARDRGEDPLDDRRHRVELGRVVRLVGLEEGPRLLGRAVAAPDQGDRDRLAQPQLVGERPRLRVGVGLGRGTP